MENPAFFVENQADNVNPHDVLNDPYRSAFIIISHVTLGDEMARQYRLPARLRNFIMEHHGTTQVLYFYRQAVAQAGNEAEVDIEQFTYPGPRPQSRETAIMMLADTCESTIRARRPTSKQEISDIVQEMIEVRMRAGQLDESRLTLNDIKAIRNIFIEMLQAVFHPRINYPAALPKPPGVRTTTEPGLPVVRSETALTPEVSQVRTEDERKTELSTLVEPVEQEVSRPQLQTKEIPVMVVKNDDDNSPLPDVPPLPRTGEHRSVKPEDNGRKSNSPEKPAKEIKDNE
jgi:hypothetical protein